MKLSTAIRIGSMTTKQIIRYATDGGNGRCAIGAALDAVGVSPIELTEWIKSFKTRFPKMTCYMDMIYCMNDSFKFSREEIADVVEALENLMDRNWEKPLMKKETVICPC